MTEDTTPSALRLTPAVWQQIAAWLGAADIDCIEIALPGQALRMVRGAGTYRVEAVDAAAAAPQDTAAPAGLVPVVSRSAGILLARHPDPAAARFAQAGERVQAGELVGLLQIGLVLAPVVAPAHGTLGEWRVAPGTLVGYGTRLADILAGDS